MNKSLELYITLEKSLHKTSVAPIFDIPFSRVDYVELDFSQSNKAIFDLDLSNTGDFNHFVFNTISDAGARVGFGGYNEDRIIYQRSSHFQGEESRSVHLGIDLWAGANTSVYAPLDGAIHSFADNKGMGNYGPTIILEHFIDQVHFYTLYGHLSRLSLQGLYLGKKFNKGEKLGELGNYPENGDWPPHLHFQIITDLLGSSGDFPGVSRPSEREKFLTICPDPNWILKFPTS